MEIPVRFTSTLMHFLRLAYRSKRNLGIDEGYVGCLKDLKISFVDYDLLYPGAHILKQKNIVKCPDDPCQTRPCENAGKCKFDTKMGNTYICLCPKGYVGKRCQAKGELFTGLEKKWDLGILRIRSIVNFLRAYSIF